MSGEAAVRELDEADLRALLRPDGGLVMVDFWAAWCGSCRLLAPAVARIAREHEAVMTVGTVDVDRLPHVAEEHGVHGLPAILFFRGGELVRRVSGVQGKPFLDAVVSDLLGESEA